MSGLFEQPAHVLSNWRQRLVSLGLDKWAHRVLITPRLIGLQEFGHKRYHRSVTGSRDFYPNPSAFVPSQGHNVDFPHLGVRVTAIGEGELLGIESPECRGVILLPQYFDVLLLVQSSDDAPVGHDEFIEGLAAILTASSDDVHETGKGHLTTLYRERERNPGPIRHGAAGTPVRGILRRETVPAIRIALPGACIGCLCGMPGEP